MKKHKFFLLATKLSLAMTMVTGYKKTLVAYYCIRSIIKLAELHRTFDDGVCLVLSMCVNLHDNSMINGLFLTSAELCSFTETVISLLSQPLFRANGFSYAVTLTIPYLVDNSSRYLRGLSFFLDLRPLAACFIHPLKDEKQQQGTARSLYPDTPS